MRPALDKILQEYLEKHDREYKISPQLCQEMKRLYRFSKEVDSLLWYII